MTLVEYEEIQYPTVHHSSSCALKYFHSMYDCRVFDLRIQILGKVEIQRAEKKYRIVIYWPSFLRSILELVMFYKKKVMKNYLNL